MLVLAVDTSGREGSVALACGDDDSCEILQSLPLAGGMYSAELVPKISELLTKHNLRKTEVDLFSVCSGPGSFTGLRVGLATVKGLAEVLQKPLVATTVLEAICMNAARQGSLRGNVVSALDAQRGEVFSGEYEFSGAVPVKLCEALSSLNDFSVWLSAKTPRPPAYCPDAALTAKLVEKGLGVQAIARPTAADYARIGLQKFAGGITVPAAELDADYIRRSDAEIFSPPKK